MLPWDFCIKFDESKVAMKYVLSLVLVLTVLLVLNRYSFAQGIDSLFIQSAIKKLEHARAYTLQVAEAMPANQFSFKPNERSMTFAQQLHHLAENLGWLSSAYLKNESNPISKTQPVDKEVILQELEIAYDYAIQALRAIPPHSLADVVSFFAGPMTKLQIINLINDHQTHHRAQLVVYLNLAGIKPPSYIGW